MQRWRMSPTFCPVWSSSDEYHITTGHRAHNGTLCLLKWEDCGSVSSCRTKTCLHNPLFLFVDLFAGVNQSVFLLSIAVMMAFRQGHAISTFQKNMQEKNALKSTRAQNSRNTLCNQHFSRPKAEAVIKQGIKKFFLVLGNGFIWKFSALLCFTPQALACPFCPFTFYRTHLFRKPFLCFASLVKSGYEVGVERNNPPTPPHSN